MIRNSKKARRAGFTLLELLLVVGILVMLAAFAIPSVMGTKTQTEKDTAQAQIGAFEDVLRIYQSQNNSFPTTEQGLKALVEKPEDDPVPKKWAGPYLSEPNFNDPWGRPYHYEYPGEHNGKKKPDIWSDGPAEDDDADNIVNWKEEGAEKSDSDGKRK